MNKVESGHQVQHNSLEQKNYSMSEKLEFSKQDRWEGTQLTEIVEELKLTADTVAKEPREYIIKGEVTAANLYELTLLPFEISIDENNGRLVLGTGLDTSAAHDWNFEAKRRPERAKVSFHTHPVIDGVAVNTPSLNDLYIQLTRAHNNLNTSIIGTQDGLLVFTYYLDSADSVATQTAEYKKMSSAVDEMQSLQKKLYAHQINFAEAVLQQRKLFEESGLLVFEARWDESEKIEKVLDMFR